MDVADTASQRASHRAHTSVWRRTREPFSWTSAVRVWMIAESPMRRMFDVERLEPPIETGQLNLFESSAPMDGDP